MKKRITINNHLINGPGNISPTPTPPPPVPITEDLLFIGRDGGITVYDVAKGQIVTEIENVGTPTDILINTGRM
ncbi:hypothetical protein DH09_20070 [Bacillaceae bacterium JMAK1]|nr:hypothetical protein DH09_20070 [Bacillaceae bacterium JMAK1]